MVVNGQYWYQTKCCPPPMEPPHFGILISNSSLPTELCPLIRAPKSKQQNLGWIGYHLKADEYAYSTTFVMLTNDPLGEPPKDTFDKHNHVLSDRLQIDGDEPLNGKQFRVIEFVTQEKSMVVGYELEGSAGNEEHVASVIQSASSVLKGGTDAGPIFLTALKFWPKGYPRAVEFIAPVFLLTKLNGT